MCHGKMSTKTEMCTGQQSMPVKASCYACVPAPGKAVKDATWCNHEWTAYCTDYVLLLLLEPKASKVVQEMVVQLGDIQYYTKAKSSP